MSTPFILPETGLVREKTVLQHIAPVARSTLWRWRRCGTFPAPVQMGDNTNGYRAEDLRSWLANRQETHA
ncbi:helix-turn-helix transcriptional regulator [Cedecea sp. NFIX57]|uniref:helix-turn-helix transcriptional regulator n=1 Tax=Cedecea sp. NFIX57 TaxID=1566286 RepID=UPI000A09E79E|nr:AlpA family phage regulatory protein [Cedecea sp. NFIX57]SMG61817.1 transcriptional regulator, AlpA family [Cedecea sp. NFIX57]